MNFSIVEFDGVNHVRLGVDCAPFGERDFLCEIIDGDEEEVRGVMMEIAADWPQYWAKTLETVHALFGRYDEPDHFQTTAFQVLLQKSGGWVDDDFFFEVVFEEEKGFWAVFFKDGEVIHSQQS